MTDKMASTRLGRLLGFGVLLGVSLLSADYALAADCPGNPNALGTSRTLVVDPREHPRIGTMQYSETLPLEDHEVVLTFDDGPIPKYSNQILAILAEQCVKATFFEIGRMATQYPEGVRKLIAAGHTVGTHTQNHPLSMNRMPIEHAQQEIDQGIASTKATLSDPTQVAPFMRIPGLLRATVVEDYLASQGIQLWSADFPADDWRHISPQQVHDLAISRIEAKGKGILLLHDIQARTVAALPQILSDLKARGYRIVHVVPATPTMPKTPTDPQQWQMHPTSETVAVSHWQKIPNFVYADTTALPGPAVTPSDQKLSLTESFGRSRHVTRGSVPMPEQAPWPRETSLQSVADKLILPVPAKDLFQIAEHGHTPIKALASLPHQAQQISPATKRGPDGIARLISMEAVEAQRIIPGSMPLTQPGLQPGPVTSR